MREIYTANTINEARDLLTEHADDDARIIDSDGCDLYPDGDGGVCYADGANAEYYGPMSSVSAC